MGTLWGLRKHGFLYGWGLTYEHGPLRSLVPALKESNRSLTRSGALTMVLQDRVGKLPQAKKHGPLCTVYKKRWF